MAANAIGSASGEHAVNLADLKDATHPQIHSDHVSWIGATLVAGFVFMLLVDQLSHKLSAGNI